MHTHTHIAGLFLVIVATNTILNDLRSDTMFCNCFIPKWKNENTTVGIIRGANGPLACGITWVQSSIFQSLGRGGPGQKRATRRTLAATFSTLGRSRPRFLSILGRPFSDLDFRMDLGWILTGFGLNVGIIFLIFSMKIRRFYAILYENPLIFLHFLLKFNSFLWFSMKIHGFS